MRAVNKIQRVGEEARGSGDDQRHAKPSRAALQADDFQAERDRVAGGETDDGDAGEHGGARGGDTEMASW